MKLTDMKEKIKKLGIDTMSQARKSLVTSGLTSIIAMSSLTAANAALFDNIETLNNIDTAMMAVQFDSTNIDYNDADQINESNENLIELNKLKVALENVSDNPVLEDKENISIKKMVQLVDDQNIVANSKKIMEFFPMYDLDKSYPVVDLLDQVDKNIQIEKAELEIVYEKNPKLESESQVKDLKKMKDLLSDLVNEEISLKMIGYSFYNANGVLLDVNEYMEVFDLGKNEMISMSDMKKKITDKLEEKQQLNKELTYLDKENTIKMIKTLGDSLNILNDNKKITNMSEVMAELIKLEKGDFSIAELQDFLEYADLADIDSNEYLKKGIVDVSEKLFERVSTLNADLGNDKSKLVDNKVSMSNFR